MNVSINLLFGYEVCKLNLKQHTSVKTGRGSNASPQPRKRAPTRTIFDVVAE